MKNTGALFANDVNKDRAKAVAANFHRLGITNGVISTLDGRKYPSVSISFYFFSFFSLLSGGLWHWSQLIYFL